MSTEPELDAAPRGVFTSEFLLAVATMVSALVLALTGLVDGEVALAAITAASGAYGISRGLAKRG